MVTKHPMKYQRLTQSVILVSELQIRSQSGDPFESFVDHIGPADVPSTFLPAANRLGSDSHKNLSSFAGLTPHSSANEEKDETLGSLLAVMFSDG
jgi:hypothetical protein